MVDRRAALALGVGATASALFGCTKPSTSVVPPERVHSPSTSSGPAELVPGQTALLRTLDDAVLAVTVAAPQENVSSGNDFEVPKQGQFFVLSATVELRSAVGAYYADVSAFRLNWQGAEYEHRFITTIEPAFISGPLQTGDEINGKLVFDTPMDLRIGAGSTVAFVAPWTGKPAAIWRV